MALTTKVKRNPSAKQADSDMSNDPTVWQEPFSPEGGKKRGQAHRMQCKSFHSTCSWVKMLILLPVLNNYTSFFFNDGS